MHRGFATKKYDNLSDTVWGRKVICCDSLILGGKKPVETHAAVWVPDSEANICMHCKKTQFTMLIRRVSLGSIVS